MRYRPARYRNGYHRTLTHKQRRNRWLLWGVLAMATVGGNRWVAGCQPVEPSAEPATILVSAASFIEAHRS